jgi:tetratricopeptide (TPR) repeat protein
LALDRDATLKKAEKLVRQGRLEPAIAEYLRIVEENPRDWSTANTLGELYMRAGQPERAVEEYTRIAEHFVSDGFYPKAAALYKKVLKILPQDETTQLRLAEISAKQGLLADAKSYLNAIASRRRAAEDRRGLAEIVVRLGSIDPADFDARLLAARTLEEMGDEAEAVVRFQALHIDFAEKGRTAEAIDALKEVVRLSPLDLEARSRLAKVMIEAGDVMAARQFLDEHSAGADPALLFPLAEIELRSGELARASDLLARLLGVAPARRAEVFDLGRSFVESSPETAFTCIDAAVDAALTASDYQEASARLQEFVALVPRQIPALLKLVEVCVDGGLESAMYQAQEQLTDAYLAAGQGAEARAIAEDLVAREPWEPGHIDRFRRALILLRVSDPDTLIAERLSGQAPFMAHDPFFAPPLEPSAAIDIEREPAPEHESPGSMTRKAGEVENRVDSPDEGLALDVSSAATEAAVPPKERPRTTSGGSDEIDLTGALGGLEGDAQASGSTDPRRLDEAFSKIREEAAADPKFSAQHMTLARTYLEMGMVDEAQSALERAVRSPQQRVEAAAALGRLHQRRGDPEKAIEWLEQAAEAAGLAEPVSDEGRAVLYDLGVLLDDAGETSRALAVFLELQSEAGDYRDVPVRIDRLARVQTGG